MFLLTVSYFQNIYTFSLMQEILISLLPTLFIFVEFSVLRKAIITLNHKIFSSLISAFCLLHLRLSASEMDFYG